MVPELVPDVGEMDSHGWFLDAVQERVPVPPFQTLSVWGAGLAPPEVAEKVKEPGAVASAGDPEAGGAPPDGMTWIPFRRPNPTTPWTAMASEPLDTVTLNRLSSAVNGGTSERISKLLRTAEP